MRELVPKSVNRCEDSRTEFTISEHAVTGRDGYLGARTQTQLEKFAKPTPNIRLYLVGFRVARLRPIDPQVTEGTIGRLVQTARQEIPGGACAGAMGPPFEEPRQELQIPIPGVV